MSGGNTGSRIRIKERSEESDWERWGRCLAMHQAIMDNPDIDEDERMAQVEELTGRFFPTATVGKDDIAVTKTICTDCSVRAECLAHSLVTWEKAGIWGGFTETERREIRRYMVKALGREPELEVAVKWCDDTYGD